MSLIPRFLRYVQFDTQSDSHSTTYPSTKKQLELSALLLKELIDLGIPASIDDFGYVIGKLPSNSKKKIPSIALVAHVDTSPDASGYNVLPSIIKNYDGGIIVLNKEKNITLDPSVFSNLQRHIGSDLITTDGTTLLGADDKAGVAIIMALVEYYVQNPLIPHGELVVVFTPDEEVGKGTDHLDLSKVGADFGYTLDGSSAGEIAYENFNAASAAIEFRGKSVHPGSAKHKMVNAITLAMEFDRLLSSSARPELTEKYEGFNHLHFIEGMTEVTKAEYIIRNHDKTLFQAQKDEFVRAEAFLNAKYGKNTVKVTIKDSYFNMKDLLMNHQEIIDVAKEAIVAHGITPIIEPIRGGTDGARLTYMGLPCPNLGTGCYNFHGPYEYASIQEMNVSLDILKSIVEHFSL
jgi:tripeptide aminopeptidase